MTVKQFTDRLQNSPISRVQVGILIGVSETMMCRILAGPKPPPGNFLRRATAALDLLEQAQRAGLDAKLAVLATWPQIAKGL